MPEAVNLTVEFAGGMDLLFGGRKTVDICVPPGASGLVTVLEVIMYCRDHLLTERPDLFMKGDSVRPGILVLVNDADWELSGKTATEVRNGDSVVFISTLHGG
jgi:ubiquitin related modifier 1